MHIIYIHSNDLAKNETSETFVVYHALSLALYHHEVSLLLINNSNKDARTIVKSNFDLKELPDNLNIIGFKNPSNTKKRFYKSVTKMVSEMPPAVVIVRHHFILKALMSDRQAKHSYVFETHDFFYNLGIRDDVNILKKWRKRNVERRFFGQLDALIHLNDPQKKLYDKCLPKIRNIVLTTGLHRVYKTREERKNRIVFIGALNARLGLDWLIKLAGMIPKDYELVIIGGKSKEEINDFKSNFTNNSLPENVRITGWIQKKYLKKILSETKIGLLPLKDIFFNKYLIAPLKLLDCISFGIPVVSSDFPSVKSFIDNDTGCFVNWNNLNQTTDQIIQLIENDKRWHTMSKNIYLLAEKMTWDKRAKKELEFLSKL